MHIVDMRYSETIVAQENAQNSMLGCERLTLPSSL
jgi:hypothetical protein